MWNQKIQVWNELDSHFDVNKLHKMSPISLAEHRITINSLWKAYLKNSKVKRPWSFTDMNDTQLSVKVPRNHQNNSLTHSSLIFKDISSASSGVMVKALAFDVGGHGLKLCHPFHLCTWPSTWNQSATTHAIWGFSISAATKILK